jgi:O-antigen/teichoic acid export membrane protein
MLAGSTGVAQTVGILATPVLTRLYSPADFAVLAIFVAALGIVLPIASLGLERAIPIAAEEEVSALLALGLAFAGITASAVAIAAWALPGFSSASLALRLHSLGPYFLVGILLGGIHNLLVHAAIRQKLYGALSTTQMYQGLAKTTTQVVLGYPGLTPTGLLVGHVIGESGSTWTLYRRLRKSNGLPKNIRSMDACRDTFQRFRRFATVGGPSALVNAIGLHAVPIFVVGVFGIVPGGVFALAQRMIALPLTLVSAAIAKVYRGEVASRVRAESPTLGAFVRKTVRLLALAGVPPLLAVALAGPWVFGVVFGGEWSDAGIYVRILAPMYLAKFIANPLAEVLVALERQKILLLWNSSRLILSATPFVVAQILGLDVTLALILYSAGMTASFGVLAVMARYVSAQHEATHPSSLQSGEDL